ncbi:probable cytochrome P450 49a1 [Eriocheir sinensis]|uniref:probable cytochrome P450 49a1 n=1 Tax=Eriocheir sinensis TaxID=95602 RepID=UPI0021C7F592|nr:probable cytochrome P450 49a1 [Eriocheir sinensis]
MVVMSAVHQSRMFQTLLLRPSSAGLGRVVLHRLTSTTASSQQVSEAVLEEARPATEIPGPRAFPIVGSLPFIMTDKNFDSKRFHKYWASLIERYGPIVRLVNPGLGAVVAVANPEDCEKINRASTDQPQRTPLTSLKHLRDNWTDNYFEKRSGILGENGDEWWRVRSRVQNAMMKPMVVREYLAEMDDVTLTFMDRIQELQDKHGQMPDNFQEELYKWALETVGVVALDRRFGCLGAPPGSEAARRGEELISVVNNLFSSMAALELKTRVWLLFPSLFPSYRRLRDNHTKLLQIVTEQVAETVALLQEGKAEGDMQLPGERQHSVLMKLLSTPGLSQKDVLTFIMDIVFAGIDTTSHTMAFCLYLLAKNPEVQRKLQKEVDEVVGDLQGPLTPQHMARLSYAKAVIKETFRIFPLTFSLARILTQDLVLQGYRIPAGTNVFSLNPLIGWDASVFPRPDEFLPERWLRDRPLGDIHPFAIIPFGAGSRMCVGRRVAEQEMYTLLARVVQRFTVEYHHEDLEQLTGLVFYPSRPLRFNFLPR